MPVAGIPGAVVTDASVAAKWLLIERDSSAARKLLAQDVLLYAPDLLLPEAANVLWKHVRSARITERTTLELTRWLLEIPIHLSPCPPLVAAALGIARTYQRTVYDCVYVALAIRESSVLVTADEKLRLGFLGTPVEKFILTLSELA